eukprot:gene13800-15245_t
MLHHPGDYEEIVNEEDKHEVVQSQQSRSTKIPFRSKITLLLLVLINFLNYMDRYTISSVLTLIQKYFGINNTVAGLLQTVFTCSYMIFAPLFGYMGDRFPRKYVMAAGILIWSLMTYVGSLMNEDASIQFWYFFMIRGLVGIGEASYSTVSPTLIADLFVKDQRTKALSLFYFAIPCGSGLGYIAGSKVASLMGENWRWALRVTPGLGLLSAVLCIFVIREPERGANEVASQEQESSVHLKSSLNVSTYLDDLKYLAGVKSFVSATIGTTCISFVAGCVAFWAPKFFMNAQHQQGHAEVTIEQVSFIVGIITFAAGVSGVLAGAEVSRRFRHIFTNAEALVCGYGVLIGAPLLFLALFFADKNVPVTWTLVFFAEVFFCMYWVPNADLRLAVIIPTRRSTAEAVQILSQHLLGDASSPFIIGAISDALNKPPNSLGKQDALLYSLYITPLMCVLGAGAYLFCSLTLSADKQREKQLVVMEDTDTSNNHTEHSYQRGEEPEKA